jgi:hypothetical protein
LLSYRRVDRSLECALPEGSSGWANPVVSPPLIAPQPQPQPQPQDIVLHKGVPSAFFDSPLRQLLHDLDLDSVMVCGFTTSGCVRATRHGVQYVNFSIFFGMPGDEQRSGGSWRQPRGGPRVSSCRRRSRRVRRPWKHPAPTTMPA